MASVPPGLTSERDSASSTGQSNGQHRAQRGHSAGRHRPARRVGRGCRGGERLPLPTAFQEGQVPRLGAGWACGGDRGLAGPRPPAADVCPGQPSVRAGSWGPGTGLWAPNPAEMAGPPAEPLTRSPPWSPVSALRDEGDRKGRPGTTQRRGPARAHPAPVGPAGLGACVSHVPVSQASSCGESARGDPTQQPGTPRHGGSGCRSPRTQASGQHLNSPWACGSGPGARPGGCPLSRAQPGAGLTEGPGPSPLRAARPARRPSHGRHLPRGHPRPRAQLLMNPTLRSHCRPRPGPEGL